MTSDYLGVRSFYMSIGLNSSSGLVLILVFFFLFVEDYDIVVVGDFIII